MTLLRSPMLSETAELHVETDLTEPRDEEAADGCEGCRIEPAIVLDVRSNPYRNPMGDHFEYSTESVPLLRGSVDCSHHLPTGLRIEATDLARLDCLEVSRAGQAVGVEDRDEAVDEVEDEEEQEAVEEVRVSHQLDELVAAQGQGQAGDGGDADDGQCCPQQRPQPAVQVGMAQAREDERKECRGEGASPGTHGYVCWGHRAASYRLSRNRAGERLPVRSRTTRQNGALG